MVKLEAEQVEMKRTDGDFADALVSHLSPGLLFRPLRSLLPTPPHYVCLGDDLSNGIQLRPPPAACSSPIVLGLYSRLQ